MKKNAGVFISVCGLDCSGKSTAIQTLKSDASFLPQFAYTREPGGTPIGKQIREILLSDSKRVSPTEAMLFFADRVEHAQTFILPNLKSGTNVLTDRYFLSTLAYQAALPSDKGFAKNLCEFILQQGLIPVPDIMFVFDISPETFLQRKKLRGAVAGEEVNQFEDSRDLEYFSKVRSLLLNSSMDLANSGVNVILINAERSMEEVYAAFKHHILRYLNFNISEV